MSAYETFVGALGINVGYIAQFLVVAQSVQCVVHFAWH